MTGKKQSGVFVLMLVIVLALTVSSYYFSSISVTKIKLEHSLKTQTELKRAKQALLAYAVTNWREPGEGGKIGKLPCPDLTAASTEGIQDPSCGTAYGNAVGYLPWLTLGIDVPRDESGSCFLYVVSPAYKPGPPAALNPDSYGQIRIVDSTGMIIQGGIMSPEDRPVAVVIAPGKALGNQSRITDVATTCGEDYTNIPAAYLDNDGGTNNTNITADNNIGKLLNSYAGSENVDSQNPLNDRFITITHKEIWDALDKHVKDTNAEFTDQMSNLTEALALCLAGYGGNNDGHLPMPALMNLSDNEYRNNFSYDDSGVFTEGFSGRYPFDVERANDEMLLLPPLTANQNILFKNTFCDDINLPSTAGFDDNIWFTDSDDIPIVDALDGEYYDLWQNWKDHFFYAVSELHKPDVLISPGTTCTGNCVEVSAVKYAGIVFFSGLKVGLQQRYAGPIDEDEDLADTSVDIDNKDDKDDVRNYLENNNEVDFPVYSGSPASAVYPANDGYRVFERSASNDIMFCINPDMTVIECP